MNHSAAAVATALVSGWSPKDIVRELHDALGPNAPANGRLLADVADVASLTALATDSTAPPPRIDPAPTGPSACDAVRFQLELDAVRVLRCESGDSHRERRFAVSIPSNEALADFDRHFGGHCESGPPSLKGAPVAFGLRALSGAAGSQAGERLLVRGGHELWRSRDPNDTRSLLSQLVNTERQLAWQPGMLRAACYRRGTDAHSEVALIPVQLLEPLAHVVARLGRIGWRPVATLWPTLRSDGLVDLDESVPCRISYVATRHVGVDAASSAAAQLTGCAWEAVHLLGVDHRPRQELLLGARRTLSAVERLVAAPPTVLTPDLPVRRTFSALAATTR